jgi:hypothetical protein
MNGATHPARSTPFGSMKGNLLCVRIFGGPRTTSGMREGQEVSGLTRSVPTKMASMREIVKYREWGKSIHRLSGL